MSFPVFIWLGPIPIHAHVLFDGLAYAGGIQVYRWLKSHRLDPLAVTERWWIVAAAFVGAALGAKVLPILAHPSLFDLHPAGLSLWLGGKSIAGALIGGLVAVELAKWRMGITRPTGDVFAIPLAVGIAIGRIGCFLSGLEDETHGLPSGLPWAVDFGDGTPRHPAQLYEMLFLVLLLPILWWHWRQSSPEGNVFRWFMVAYFGFRFGLEFLKPGEPILGLNAIQWSSVAVLAWYAVIWRARTSSDVERADG